MNYKKLFGAFELDIFQIIYYLNTIIFFCNIAFYFFFGQYNNYINFSTVLLVSGIHIQIFYFFHKIMREGNIFYFCIVCIFLAFYAVRVTTLIFYPESIMFQMKEYSYNATNINEFLTWINLVFIGIHIFFVSIKYTHKSNAYFEVVEDRRLDNFFYLSISFLFISLFYSFYYLYITKFGRVDAGRFWSYLTVVLEYRYSLMLSVIAYLLKPNLKKTLLFIVALYIFSFFLSLTGTRSNLYSILLFFFIGLLVVHGNFKVKLKNSLTILAILLPLLYASFSFGNYARQTFLSNRIPFNYENIIKVVSTQLDNTDKVDPTNLVNHTIQHPILNRIGFLDMGTFMYAYNDNTIYNFNLYFKSLVDNLLTPGFDIYGVYPAARMIGLHYNRTTMENLKNNYNADMVTIFAESKIIFGYFGIVYICGIFYLFIMVNNNLLQSNISVFAKYYALCMLYLSFYYMINSYGLDTFIIDTSKIIIFSFAYIYGFNIFLNFVGKRKQCDI